MATWNRSPRLRQLALIAIASGSLMVFAACKQQNAVPDNAPAVDPRSSNGTAPKDDKSTSDDDGRTELKPVGQGGGPVDPPIPAPAPPKIVKPKATTTGPGSKPAPSAGSPSDWLPKVVNPDGGVWTPAWPAWPSSTASTSPPAPTATPAPTTTPPAATPPPATPPPATPPKDWTTGWGSGS